MSDVTSKLGKTIQARRKSLALTQEALAERASLASNYIRMIERGARVPHVETLERLARALDTTMAALLGAADEAADVAAPLLGFIRARRLTGEDVRRLETVARAMFPAGEVARG
ncbi:helix-turn-helix domain-containing protein [Myxococcus sp. Y35]|uniref:helix-turn-helix domain-containing protein n=1 Tax=Pseudomyxococcus flavus TaxID=3115648 RepID=UPI003CE88C7D